MHLSQPRRQRTLSPLPPLRFESCPQRIGHIALGHHRPTSSGDVSALFATRAVPHSNAFCARSTSTAFQRCTLRRLPPRSTTERHSNISIACSCAFRAAHGLAALDTSRLTFFCRQCHPQHLLRRVGGSIGSGCSLATVSSRVPAPARCATTPSDLRFSTFTRYITRINSLQPMSTALALLTMHTASDASPPTCTTISSYSTASSSTLTTSALPRATALLSPPSLPSFSSRRRFASILQLRV